MMRTTKHSTSGLYALSVSMKVRKYSAATFGVSHNCMSCGKGISRKATTLNCAASGGYFVGTGISKSVFKRHRPSAP